MTKNQIIDENTLIGQASVEFTQVNPGDDYAMQLAGMEHTECGQVYSLTLGAL